MILKGTIRANGPNATAIVHKDGSITFRGVEFHDILFEGITFNHEGQGLPAELQQMLDAQPSSDPSKVN